MGRMLSLAIVTGLWLATAAAPAQARSAQEIFRDASPSVVLLVMEDGQGRAVSLGSGFFVREGVIATDLHLLNSASRGHARPVGRTEKHAIAGVLALDRANDLVLLSAPGARAPALALSERQPTVGDTVYAIGNPKGFEGTLSQGIVSGIREARTQTLLQITAPMSPGSSGGPVLDTDGKVIGVAISTHGGQNLNFAVPARSLRGLIARAGEVKPLAAAAEEPAAAPPAAEGVVGALFIWERYSARERHYSFSLQNRLRQAVKMVSFLVGFYDRDGQPVHVESGRYDDVIPPGGAKRMGGSLDVYASDLVDRVEIKVVGFETVP